ncbi:hypothetical protein [Buttiauxella noackiae]|uniref:hypothetical protein n=1 Tax=Buttiauxella noackiae TaxID=82992 RepID=UPI00054E6804|nr:hypothetical protein [Buttiauxella noackiae]
MRYAIALGFALILAAPVMAAETVDDVDLNSSTVTLSDGNEYTVDSQDIEEFTEGDTVQASNDGSTLYNIDTDTSVDTE